MGSVRGLATLLRVLCVATLTLGFGGAAAGITGKAAPAPYETLMVPSGAMGRDIPVAFLGVVHTRCICWTPSMPRRTSAIG